MHPKFSPLGPSMSMGAMVGYTLCSYPGCPAASSDGQPHCAHVNQPRRVLKKPYGAYPAGTEVTLLEPLGSGEAWLVQVRTSDDNLVGGASYECVEVALKDLKES